MICYKDKTFCSGGTPKCAMFDGCAKALTEGVWARAKAADLPVSQFIAPTAMPCYRLTKVEPAKAPKKKRDGGVTLGMPDKAWRAEFTQMPRRCDPAIAEKLKCSTTTVRLNRIRLGYPPGTPSGVTRHTKHTEADAKRLAAEYAKGDCSFAEAGRRLGIRKNTAKHLRARFRDIFSPVLNQ